MGRIRSRKKLDSNRSVKMHLLRQGTTCGICGKEIEDLKHATIDHKVPMSRGGSDTLSNKQVAHSWCNKAKGNRLPEDGAMTDEELRMKFTRVRFWSAKRQRRYKRWNRRRQSKSRI